MELRTTPSDPCNEARRLREALRRTRDLKAGLIFHFIKKADHFKARKHDLIIPCRHGELRRKVWQQAIDIRGAHRSRRYGRYILGIDAANSELNARPEVFAPAIRWLRASSCQPVDPVYATLIRRFEPNEPRSLGLTFHAGEDYRHLLSGLRTVDEALQFLDMGPGDRIGHGLALGVPYETWCRRVGGEVAMPRGEWLDNLVWLRQKLAVDPGRFGRLLFAIDDRIHRLAREIYGHLQGALNHDPTDWQLLYLAWTCRHQNPLLYDRLDDLFPSPRANTLSFYEQAALTLWRAYHRDPRVRIRHDEPERVLLNDLDMSHWHEAITWVQDELPRELRQKRVAIEINPTSNLCIGPLHGMIEHPVFRWHPPETTDAAIRPAILVGSDDPGVFGTELAFEYAVLSRAAEERGATPRDIERWLRDLRDAGKAFCFLTAVSDEADRANDDEEAPKPPRVNFPVIGTMGHAGETNFAWRDRWVG